MLNLRRYFTIVLPRVFFDISAGTEQLGRLVFELRSDIVPLTCENFRRICIGSNTDASTGQKLFYKGSRLHKIIPGRLVQGGDIINGNGKGGESIYGYPFNDENFTLLHDERGVLSMANTGPNTNTSQFFITAAPCPSLDSKNVVFGKLLTGWEVLFAIEAYGSDEGIPRANIKIAHSGEIKEESHNSK